MIDYKDYILYLKSPDLERRFDIGSFPALLKLLWASFLITIGMSFIISLVISTPLRFFNLLPPLKTINFTSSNLLKISLFVPIVEELIFRLPLRISRVNIFTSLGLLMFLILQNLNVYLAFAFLIFLVGFLKVNIGKKSGILTWEETFFTKYYRWFFYSQAVLFGLLHLANFNLDFKYFYLFPLFIVVYIFIGCFWGYIRIRFKYGILVCIVTHIIVNTLYCLIILK